MGEIYGKSFMDFPSELAGKIAGSSIIPINIGKSGAEIYKIRKPDKSIIYLKIAEIKFEHELLNEVRVYDWLDRKIKTPQVLYYDVIGNKEYMLYTEVAGNIACSRFFLEISHINNMIKILSRNLKKLHSISIQDCNIDSKLETKLCKAKKRIDKGLIDEWDFLEQNKNKSCYQIYDELLANKPQTEDLVFTHGDYCLPNVIINDEEETGFVDMGRGGQSTALHKL